MLDDALKYLGQTYVGFTIPGQCLAYFNQVVLDVSGIKFPLQGADGAKDLMTCTNTRPDLFQQIWDKPGDPNWNPVPGDWVVWDGTYGNGYGHVACVESVDSAGFTAIEQNYIPNTVTRQRHGWSHVLGWIHYTPNSPTPPTPPQPTPGGDTMSDDTARQIGFNYLGRNGYDGRPNALAAPQPDLQGKPLTNQYLDQVFLSDEARSWRDGLLPQVYSDRDAYKAQVDKLTQDIANKDNEIQALNNQVQHLTEENSSLQTQLDAANKRIAELEAAGGGTNITINFNFMGVILWGLIRKLGLRKSSK